VAALAKLKQLLVCGAIPDADTAVSRCCDVLQPAGNQEEGSASKTSETVWGGGSFSE